MRILAHLRIIASTSLNQSSTLPIAETGAEKGTFSPSELSIANICENCSFIGEHQNETMSWNL